MNFRNETNMQQNQQNDVIAKAVVSDPRSLPTNYTNDNDNTISTLNNNNYTHNYQQQQQQQQQQHMASSSQPQVAPDATLSSSKQSFPPLIAPKPQKPSPIVSNN